MKAFEDGYDRTVGINEVEGLSPAVEFTYRPLVGTEVSEAYMVFLTAADKGLIKREFVADRITAWRFPSSEDASDEFSKPTAEQLGKLNAMAYQKIESVIMGTARPDYELVDAAKVAGRTNAEAAEDDAKN
jgi:hypothetical protein